MSIHHSKPALLLLLLLVGLATLARQQVRYPIIPYPASLSPAAGQFTITPATPLVSADARFEKERMALNRFFINSFGQALKTVARATGPCITLQYDAAITTAEGYTLLVTPGQVLLSARTTAGMFRAVQTVRQLLPATVQAPAAHAVTKLVLPAVTIHDAPAYAWRGMHLDVSRHFFSLAYLKKFVDVMALYKFNKFHLHLTDDQGWRIEIKKYPLLTEKGAWRTFNHQDSACMKRAVDNPDFAIDPAHIIQKEGKTLYGGFYTQAEMKELVAYAADNHIDIIPEIDMPGHMMAAISQYNWLSCDSSNTFGELFSTPICPCLPATFTFAQDIFTELMDIFPGTYIHIGGDEVDRSLWAKSAGCKALMQQEGLKNVAELQSYFINKMEKFFNARGRKMIGWDEVLEGGVSNTAVIMYWRSWMPNAPIDAARNGNAVIMAPVNSLYFDGLPDKNSLKNVYYFDPVPNGLTKAQAANIIGAQACIWTESIPTENRADYMYMPRMTALAEVLWTHRQQYNSYLSRLRSHFSRLDVLNVHYRFPDLPGIYSSNVFTSQATLSIKAPLPNLHIRYTTDSSAPNAQSTILNEPLIIRRPQVIRLATFRADGTRGDIYTLQYQQQTLAAPETIVPAREGLTCSQFKGSFRFTTRMPGTKPDTVLTVRSISVPKALEAPAFGLKYRGYLNIPQDGIYGFFLTCDDGGLLKIAGREVVNNDGNHSAIEKNGQVALKKGYHSFALDFIEGGGGYQLELKYSINGSEPRSIPAEWFKH